MLIQDPVSAKFDGMPNSAIATGFADYIMAPELMPETIFDYINERPVRLATESRPDESQLPEVLKLIEKHCQHDFTNYKSPTLLRRSVVNRYREQQLRCAGPSPGAAGS